MRIINIKEALNDLQTLALQQRNKYKYKNSSKVAVNSWSDLVGGSLRRCTPWHDAGLRRGLVAGYRWRWPFHRSAPEAAEGDQMRHQIIVGIVPFLGRRLVTTWIWLWCGHLPILWAAATQAGGCTRLWESSERWRRTWGLWPWPEGTDGQHDEHFNKAALWQQSVCLLTLPHLWDVGPEASSQPLKFQYAANASERRWTWLLSWQR